MKKTILLLLCALSISLFSFAQQESTDTSKSLSEVTVRAFEQNRKLSNCGLAVKIIDVTNGDRYNKTSLVNGFNTIAGVRMEERSPGSYRINIRGSSLRSPFGVRNVKVYWNDIPITDPSGNTYFNQFAWNNFSSIEILKGPVASMYGAGTGGLILLHNFDRWQPGVSAEYVTGSYNLQNIFLSARFGQAQNRNQLTYAHNQSDGYRVQTAMRKDNLSWTSQLKTSEKQQLTASLLFTNMYYQTPGALTLAEYKSNPKAARPAGGGFPSAVNAQAAIFQKTITAGFSNEYKITEHFKNTSTVYGTFAQIKNSAIRNFERRNEPQYGARSTFNWNGKTENTEWQVVAGAEFQQGYFNTQVSNNKNGNPDTIQTNDDIRYTSVSTFIQADMNVNEKWLLTAGFSVNKSDVVFSRLSVYPVIKQSRSYKNEFTPRISLVRKFNSDFSLLGTVSKGFSPPTIAELLPSTGVISTDLEAEEGWNYEMTARYNFFHGKLRTEATGFYFKLNHALVQRRDLSGADYFVNAGDIEEKGLELHADYTYAPHGKKLLNYITLNTDYTYNHFRYGSFVKGSDDFSGKQVPSVPSGTLSFTSDIQFKNGVYVNITYYNCSKIYLNDANTFVADAYHLLDGRIGWKTSWKNKFKTSIYFGADNLLNEKYSLGNDINAAANRFYNAAPPLNFYIGASFQFIK